MYIFPFTRIRYINTITINTHIDCLNNSKCSVRDILLATKQGAFESVFGTFSVSLYTKTGVISVMGSPINVGGQYPFITFFTVPRLSGKFLLHATTYTPIWVSEKSPQKANITKRKT